LNGTELEIVVLARGVFLLTPNEGPRILLIHTAESNICQIMLQLKKLIVGLPRHRQSEEV
jgi:hypothetical protein